MFTYELIAPRVPTCPNVQIDNVAWHARRIPRSHSRHITGLHSPGPGQALIPHESLAEKGVIEALLRQPEVRAVLAQPFTVHYWVNGRRRRYTPDFLVVAQPVPPLLARQGFAVVTVLEVKGDRCLPAGYLHRLEVSQAATGIPVVLVRLAKTEVGHAL